MIIERAFNCRFNLSDMDVCKRHLTSLLLVFSMLSVGFITGVQHDKIEGLWFNDVKSAKILITKGRR